MDQPADDDPRLEIDQGTGRPILAAPRRRLRPIHTAPKSKLGPCPFCPGEEHQTPPESDAIRPDGGAWTARAFPNLYPAAPHHEVIVEGDQHLDQPGDLSPARVRDALELWGRRVAALEALPDIRATFLFKNVGRFAGASVEHNHSQLLGLSFLPPRFELQLRRFRVHGDPVAAAVSTAEDDGRTIWRGDRFVLIAPPTPRLPDETWLVPLQRTDFLESAAEDEELSTAVFVAWRALRGALDRPAFNMWLHRIPDVPAGGYPWHFEIQPRTGFIAGLELGTDMTINAVRGAETAAKLRSSVPHLPGS